MNRTGIEWTEFTWNPLRGCSRVSEGCRNCYAERMAARFSGGPCIRHGDMGCTCCTDPGLNAPFNGFAMRNNGGEARWTGRVELIPEKLEEPLHWRKPRSVFVNSMSDLFHEALPDEAIDRVFAVMALCQQHTFQVLTKRPERMRVYLSEPGLMMRWGFWASHAIHVRDGGNGTRAAKIAEFNEPTFPLPNVWLGVSVEDQKTADERIPLLLQTPAAVRFVSYEPALGPVDVEPWLSGWKRSVDYPSRIPGGCEIGVTRQHTPRLDWVICGGESGPGARPCRIEWIESIIAQCCAAGTPCFVKQLGANPIWAGAKASPVNHGDGKNSKSSEWPESLRVQEIPNAMILEVRHAR